MRGRRWSALGVAALVAAAVLTTAAGGPARTASAEPGDACQASDNGRFADCESGYYSWVIRQANGDLFNPAALGPGTTYGDPRTTLGPVHCDDGVPGEDGAAPPAPGCVVADQVPTFVINSPEFTSRYAPVHAAFVASAQTDPRTMGYGRPGSGRPLVREIPVSRMAKDAKRAAGVCGRDFRRYASPAGTPDAERDSCDEYPYSSTREGVRPYAVAGHVPQRDNNDAGGRLGEF